MMPRDDFFPIFIRPAQLLGPDMVKGTLLGTPKREPQQYSRNIMEYKDPGRYIPIIYLLYSWGSRCGVPSRVPFMVPQVQLLKIAAWHKAYIR